MPDERRSTPVLMVDASSYEARRSSAPASGPTPSPAAPPAPHLSTAAPPARVIDVVTTEQRRTRAHPPRARELFDRLARRNNEFWELLLGPHSGSGWGASLLVHAIVATALAFLLVNPEFKEPPKVITGYSTFDAPPAIGTSIGDVEIEQPVFIQDASVANVLASGGSTGNSVANFFGQAGQSAGQGRGSGAGAGDGVGAEIAGRVAAAGGKGGKLQISIGWSDRNDVDLHVVGPDGQRIYYAQPIVANGGTLDVDMNVNGETTTPVENVTWGEAIPPDGPYLVQVHFFKRNIGGPTQSPFTVRLQMGDDVRFIKGIALPGRLLTVAALDVQSGAAIAVNTTLSDQDESDVQSEIDPKRAANRERSARDALTDARSTADVKLKAGKLRRIIERFAGTESAEEARELLQGLAL